MVKILPVKDVEDQVRKLNSVGDIDAAYSLLKEQAHLRQMRREQTQKEPK